MGCVACVILHTSHNTANRWILASRASVDCSAERSAEDVELRGKKATHRKGTGTHVHRYVHTSVYDCTQILYVNQYMQGDFAVVQPLYQFSLPLCAIEVGIRT